MKIAVYYSIPFNTNFIKSSNNYIFTNFCDLGFHKLFKLNAVDLRLKKVFNTLRSCNMNMIGSFFNKLFKVIILCNEICFRVDFTNSGTFKIIAYLNSNSTFACYSVSFFSGFSHTFFSKYFYCFIHISLGFL